MKRCSKTAAVTAAAAALTPLLGPTGARAAFTVTVSAPTTSGGFNIYNVSALNTGGTTGTKLDEISSTIATTGTTSASAIVIQLTDLDGDGQPDANVNGSGLTTTSAYSYERIGAYSSFSSAFSSPSPTTTDPGGTGFQTQSINAAYTAGNVHSLEVDGISNSGGAAANTGSGAIFAHVVVPVNTYFTVSGNVGGDVGVTQNFSVSDASTVSIVQLTAGATVPAAGFGSQLTASTATFSPATPVASSLNVAGTTPGTAHVTATGGTAAASVLASGFTAGAAEKYALNLLVNGSAPTAAQIGLIVTDINASSATDGVTAAALTTANAGGISATAFDLLLTSTVTGQSQDVLAFNFADEVNVTGVTVSDVAAVTAAPEPASMLLLGVPAAGLLASRRRRA